MRRVLLLCAALLAAPGLPEARGQIEFDPVGQVPVEAVVEPAGVAAGAGGVINLAIGLPPGVHITDRELGFFFLEADSLPGLDWSLVSYPAGVEFEGGMVYRGRVELALPLTVAPSMPPGEYRVG